MIYESLELVRNELGNFLELKNQSDDFEDPVPFTSNDVVLGNVAMVESGNGDNNLDEKVIISLVNIEEERTLKNVPSFQRSPVNGNIEYFNPPVHLNLYLLFTANFSQGAEPYGRALQQISYIIQFFQSKT